MIGENPTVLSLADQKVLLMRALWVPLQAANEIVRFSDVTWEEEDRQQQKETVEI